MSQQADEDRVGQLQRAETDMELAEQVRQLREAVAQQQAELAALRTELRGEHDVGGANQHHPGLPAVRHARRDKTSRRHLLAGMGATAAAATVALVTSEQRGAQAAPAPDMTALMIGEINTGTSETFLSATSTSTASPFFEVDTNNSANGNATAMSCWGGGQPGGTGLYAYGGGYAVYASSDIGYGVYGSGTTGVYGGGNPGVHGLGGGSTSYGVLGENNYPFNPGGTAILGSSTIGVDVSAGGTGRVMQKVRGSAGAPTGISTTYTIGEMIRDSNGELWLCVATGTPGTWVQAAHPTAGYAGGATTYLSKPVRLLDTRNIGDALNNGTGAPLTDNGSSPSYTLTVAGVSYNTVDVPASAVGAIGNVTVVATPAGYGYVALVPRGAGFAGTSNINYGASQIIANFFNVGLSADGKLDIYIGGSPTQVIIDIFAVVA